MQMMTTFPYGRLFFNRSCQSRESVMSHCCSKLFYKKNLCTSVEYVIETYALNWPWHNNWHREIDMLQAVIQKKPIYGLYSVHSVNACVYAYKCTHNMRMCVRLLFWPSILCSFPPWPFGCCLLTLCARLSIHFSIDICAGRAWMKSACSTFRS